MINSRTEFGISLLKVVGAQAGLTYLSAPITTGYRDLLLMREMQVGKQDLRERFPREFQQRVIIPNEREAHKYAQMVRRLDGRTVVINPGELFVPDWTQRDYMTFWEDTIRSFCMEVVLVPGWEYSTGARYEASVSLRTALKISDVQGRALSPANLNQIDARARVRLLDEGFPSEQIDIYMPPIDFVAVSSNPDDFDKNVSAFSDIIVRHNEDARRRNQNLKNGSDLSEHSL
jgi:hypothetical protein